MVRRLGLGGYAHLELLSLLLDHTQHAQNLIVFCLWIAHASVLGLTSQRVMVQSVSVPQVNR